MQLRLSPDPGPALVQALASLLGREGLLGVATGPDGTAWRREALREGVERGPASRAQAPDRAYVAAPSPRSTRGATRA